MATSQARLEWRREAREHDKRMRTWHNDSNGRAHTEMSDLYAEGHVGGVTPSEKERSNQIRPRLQQAIYFYGTPHLTDLAELCLAVQAERGLLGFVGRSRLSHCRRALEGLDMGYSAKNDSLDVFQATLDFLEIG